MQAPRSNIRAGIGTIAVLVAGSALLWGWLEWRASRRVEFKVRFTAEQGVYGLRPGAPLRVGGITRGMVERIDPDIRGDGRVDYLATVQIDPDVPVNRRTRIEARAEDVSGDTVLVAVNVGRSLPMTRGSGMLVEAGALKEGEEIPGQAADRFLAWGGTANAGQLRALYERWLGAAPGGATLTEALKADWNDLGERFPPLRREVAAVTEAAAADFPGWRDRFVQVRRDAAEAMDRLGTAAGAPPDRIVPGMREVATQVRDMPAVEAERFARAGDSFDAAVASVRSLGRRSGDLRAMLSDAELSLGATGADYAVAGAELAATKRDAITSPWRLVGSPGEDERRDAARVDLVRVYAEAAVEHQRAMKGIEDALRRDGALLRQEPALAALLRARLDAANALFESRLAGMEQALLGPAAAPAKAP